jgi:hypothetical protein
MRGKTQRRGRHGRRLLELLKLKLLLLIEQLLLEEEQLLILHRRRCLLVELLQLELLLRHIVLEKLLLHLQIGVQCRRQLLLLLQLLQLQRPLVQLELLGAQLLRGRTGRLSERHAGHDEEAESNKPLHGPHMAIAAEDCEPAGCALCP